MLAMMMMEISCGSRIVVEEFGHLLSAHFAEHDSGGSLSVQQDDKDNVTKYGVAGDDMRLPCQTEIGNSSRPTQGLLNMPKE